MVRSNESETVVGETVEVARELLDQMPLGTRQLPPTAPVDWDRFVGDPPPRTWWLEGEWLAPDPTFFAGAGGAGKSRVMQAIGASLVTASTYLAPVSRPLRVLLWSCEENEEEIWRMQDAINRHLKVTMQDLKNLHIVPRRGLENTLFDLSLGRPTLTPLYKQLHQQVNDLKADVLALDNAAHVYGANENDRYQVTRFVNSIAGLVRDRPFCSVILGHTSRKDGSEFSGSAAWENACRMRWYLGASLPDQKFDADEPVEPDVVYLAKRKTNYGSKDWRRLRFRNGLFVPDEPEGRSLGQGYRDDDAERVVLEAIPRLKAAGLLPTDAKNGQDYLPSQILAKGYAQGFSKKDLMGAMNRLMGAGRLRRDRVGTYSNRSPRFGLVIP